MRPEFKGPAELVGPGVGKREFPKQTIPRAVEHLRSVRSCSRHVLFCGTRLENACALYRASSNLYTIWRTIIRCQCRCCCRRRDVEGYADKAALSFLPLLFFRSLRAKLFTRRTRESDLLCEENTSSRLKLGTLGAARLFLKYIFLSCGVGGS